MFGGCAVETSEERETFLRPASTFDHGRMPVLDEDLQLREALSLHVQ